MAELVGLCNARLCPLKMLPTLSSFPHSLVVPTSSVYSLHPSSTAVRCLIVLRVAHAFEIPSQYPSINENTINRPACQPNGAPVLANELQWLCNDDVTSPMRRGSTPSSSPSGGGRSGGGSGWLEEQMPWESVEVSDNGYFLRRLIAR